MNQISSDILRRVIKMKSNRQMLSSILKTTQMGQVGIRSVLSADPNPGLRMALESQLREYDSIEDEAHSIAYQRGWELPELQSGVKMMSDMMTRMKMFRDKSDSRIADMMIQGNTRGMITSLKNLHQWNNQDSRVSALSQKLLDCENANIRQMQQFL